MGEYYVTLPADLLAERRIRIVNMIPANDLRWFYRMETGGQYQGDIASLRSLIHTGQWDKYSEAIFRWLENAR